MGYRVSVAKLFATGRRPKRLTSGHSGVVIDIQFVQGGGGRRSSKKDKEEKRDRKKKKEECCKNNKRREEGKQEEINNIKLD